MTRKSDVTSSLARRLFSFSFAALLVAGLLAVLPSVTKTAPAQAAEIPFKCVDTLYSTFGSNVYRINLPNGAMTKEDTFAYDTTLNALAITAKGQAGYAMGPAVAVNSTFEAPLYQVGTQSAIKTVTGLGAATTMVAGAMNPKTGHYWIGHTSGSNLIAYEIDPTATGTRIAPLKKVTVPMGMTANGNDMAFDSRGNLYVVVSHGTNGGNKMLQVKAAALVDGATVATTKITDLASGSFPGIAFGSNGYIYVQGGSVLMKLKPTTGARVTADDLTTTSGGTAANNTDLASCATPGVMDNVVKDITARKKAGDQFTVSLSGPDLATLTGTTDGTDVGLQTGATEIAGPSLVLPGTEYTFTETAGNTNTVMSDYLSTYECTTESGTVVTSGSGTSGKVTVPAADSFGVNANITCVFTNTPVNASLALTKTAAGSPAKAGDPITYTYSVRNTGNVQLTNVAIADPQLGSRTITCAATTLAVGASTSCSVSSAYPVTQGDVDAGTAGGTATATAAYGSTSVTATASSSTPIARTAVLKLEKSATGTPTKAGQTITYSFKVTNTGNTTITGVRVNDVLLGSNAVTCPTTTLAPGASVTCTAAPYTVKQGDVDAGTVANTATVTGTPPTGVTLTTDPTSTGSTVTPLTRTSQLALVKSATGTPKKAGDAITYSFKVTNTGNTTITGVRVTDVLLGANAVTCPTTTLAPGASVTCTAAPYTVTQGDVDAGTVANSATATGTGPDGTPVAPSTSSGSSTATPIVAAGRLSVTLSQSTTQVSKVGQKIAYTHVVTNTGDATLSQVAVTDTLGTTITSTGSGPIAPGATRTFTSEYTVTQADLDAGKVVNTSTGTASTSSGSAVTGTSSRVEKTIVASAGLLAMLAAEGAPSKRGDTITYRMTVRNIGDVNVTGVSATDMLGRTYTCAATSLAPGVATTCTATYPVTQGDVDAGGVTNTGTATGATLAGAPLKSTTNAVVTPIAAVPSLNVAMVASGTPTKARDTITYTVTVTNQGNTSVDRLKISDPLGLTYTCVATSLAPGASTTCTADYAVTQVDVDAGRVADHAQANAYYQPAAVIGAPSNVVTTPIAPAPELTTTLSQSATAVVKAGDQITYLYSVRNTGNVTATDLKVTDTRGLTPSCTATTLAPGESTTCTATYTVTQAQVEAGTVANTATATAKAPSGAAITDDSAEVTTTIAAAAAISVALSQSTAAVSKAGDGVLYTYTVTNTGNLALRDLQLSDSRKVASPCVTTLAVGETVVCSATYSVSQAEVDAGVVANLANVGASADRGPAVSAVSARVEKSIVRTDGMTTTLEASGTPKKDGDEITYTVTVENTGNTTITEVAAKDTLGGTYVCDVATLAPGAKAICTSTHEVTQAEVNAGTVSNTATGSGTASSGALSDASDEVTTPIVRSPELTSTLLDSGTPTKAGDTITYRLTVENTGNVSLGTIAATDDLGTTYTCAATALHPGERTTCTATYQVTQADVDRGTVENTAEVTGAGAPGVTATDTSNDVDTTIPADAKLATGLVPSGTPTKKGDEITWTATVRNTGNVTVDTVAVSDTLGNTYVCAPRTLAPNAAATCVATDAVTQTEVNAGEVVTTATGSAKTPSGAGVSADSAERTVEIVPGPALTVVLSQSSGAITKAGQTIDYTYVVENTGNVTLSGLRTSDRLSQPQSCDAAGLLPGDTANCTTSYTVTQADVDRGEVVQLVSAFTRAPDGTAVEGDSNQVRKAIAVAPAVETTVETSGTPTKKGDEITYTVTVENTGNVTIDDVTATDTLGNTYVCVPTTLLPGEKATCTATYEVTQGDVDRGSVENTVTGGGESPSGTSTTDPAPKTTTTIAADPELTTTVVTTGTPEKAGDTIDLTVTVENTGNVTITQPTVTDSLGHTYECDATRVAPGDKVTCTATHTVTQADVDRGEVATVVTGEGRAPSGDVVEDDAPRTVVTIVAAPRLTITDASAGALVDADQDGRDSAGDTVTYTYVVRNAGNVTLTDAVVTDTLGTVVECVPATLSPGQSATCVSVPVPVTQDQLDAGEVRTHGVAVATPPTGPEVTSADSDELVTPLRAAEALSIVTRIDSWKDVNGDGLLNRGDLVFYAFDVTNTGTQTLDGLEVRDRRLAEQKIAIDCPAPFTPVLLRPRASVFGPTLAPGRSTTCVGVSGYVVTSDDVQVRRIENDATAEAVVRRTGDAIEATSTVVVSTPVASPKLSITTDADVKDVNRNGVTDAGDTIRYTYTVTNDGDITLENVRLTDERLTDQGITITCKPTTLAPGESATCTTSAPYVVTAEDVRNGAVVDSAVAHGQDPVSSTVTDVSSEQSESVVETQAPEDEALEDEEPPAKRDERPLADTGGPAVAIGALGVVALGAGLGLVGAARRRRDEAA